MLVVDSYVCLFFCRRLKFNIMTFSVSNKFLSCDVVCFYCLSMAKKIENCCVGNISQVKDDCHQVIHTNKVCITLISDLQNTDQRVIKLRVQSENIKKICAHHYYVFFYSLWKREKSKEVL